MNSCKACQKQAIKCSHPSPNYWKNIKATLQKRTLKPFILCIALEIFLQFSALLATRPYIIQIFKAYGIPLDANLAAVYMTIASNISCLCLIIVIKLLGKRKLYLGSSIFCMLTCIGLSKYLMILEKKNLIFCNQVIRSQVSMVSYFFHLDGHRLELILIKINSIISNR